MSHVTAEDSLLSLGQLSLNESYFSLSESKSRFEVFPVEGVRNFHQSYFQIDFDQTQTKRKVYSAMDWMGDAGGFYNALKILASLLVGLFQSNLFTVELVTSVFSRQTD